MWSVFHRIPTEGTVRVNSLSYLRCLHLNIACLLANTGKCHIQRIFFLTFSYWLLKKTRTNNWIFIYQHLRLIIGGGRERGCIKITVRILQKSENKDCGVGETIIKQLRVLTKCISHLSSFTIQKSISFPFQIWNVLNFKSAIKGRV